MIATDPLLTVDDIIRGGACIDGTYEVLRRVSRITAVPAAMKASEIRALIEPSQHPFVDAAALVDGDGYGYGDGDGYGDGYGYGGGYGYGYGYGGGYGYGYGYGGGYGDGGGDGGGGGGGDGYGDGGDEG